MRYALLSAGGTALSVVIAVLAVGLVVCAIAFNIVRKKKGKGGCAGCSGCCGCSSCTPAKKDEKNGRAQNETPGQAEEKK